MLAGAGREISSHTRTSPAEQFLTTAEHRPACMTFAYVMHARGRPLISVNICARRRFVGAASCLDTSDVLPRWVWPLPTQDIPHSRVNTSERKGSGDTKICDCADMYFTAAVGFQDKVKAVSCGE